MKLGIYKKRSGTLTAIATIDREDYQLVSQFSWWIDEHGYALATPMKNRKRTRIRLHRLVLGLGPDDPEVDHKNRIKLDCRKSNLRLVTHLENTQNTKVRLSVAGKPCSSCFRGVSWDANRGKWQAYATVDRQRVPLGRFVDEHEAAKIAREFRLSHMSGAMD